MLIDDEVLLEKLKSGEVAGNRRILSDEEILRGRLLLSKAEHGLRLLETNIAKYRAALAGHKELPAEILSEIFLCALGDDLVTIPIVLTEVPWVCARVCSRWRKAVAKESRLWRRLSLSNYKRETLDFARSFILPTGPLCVALRDGSPAWDDLAVRRLVKPNLSRIKELYLALTIGTLNTLLKVPPDRFSTLETLELEIPPTDGILQLRHMRMGSDWARLQTFKEAFSLRNLTLAAPNKLCSSYLISINYPWQQLSHLDITHVRGVRFEDVYPHLKKCRALKALSLEVIGMGGSMDLAYLQFAVMKSKIVRAFVQEIPWEQVQELDLSMVHAPYDRLRGVLRQCGSLTDLTVYVIPGIDDGEGDTIFLPQLKLLTIVAICEDSLFRSLVVPALAKLHFTCEGSVPLASITTMLTASACHLEVFNHKKAGHLTSSPTDVHDLLRVLRSTVKFISPSITFDESILRTISRNALLPWVRKLHCRVGSPTAFADMVEVRKEDDQSPIREAVGFWATRGTQDVFDRACERLKALSDLRFRLVKVV